MTIKILGAGLAGISAAINLVKGGKEVEVHERRDEVGLQMHPNYQGLLRTHGDPKGYLNGLGLDPEFDYKFLDKCVLSTRKKDRRITAAEPVMFVKRGGEGSLEWGLYQQALDLGVEFKFNQKMAEKDVDVVAVGHTRCDMAAFGVQYENADWDDETFVYMYDDRYSPRGWYLYLVPFGDGRIEIINCCSQPYVQQVRRRFFNAIKERKVLRDVVKGAKPVHYLGGYGGAKFPGSAVRDGRYYVGEAAGFQDPFRGFGMNYALQSGKLAADAMLHGKDYDALWKADFEKQIRLDLSRRYAMVLFGDRIAELYFRKVRDGETVDFYKYNPHTVGGELLKGLFYNLEKMRFRVRGRW